MKWLERNIWEIKQSVSLSYLGGLIGALHVANYFYWHLSANLFATPVARPLLCWSYFTSCQEALRLPGQALNIFFIIYSVFAAASAIMFFTQRLIGIAWWLALFSYGIYAFLYSWEASFAQNGHAFFFALQFGFLFLPKKNFVISSLTLAYFLTDAVLKLRPEWLSGVTLVDVLPLPIKALEWIAAFSVLIELVMPFFLLSRDGQRMAYGFVSLLVLNGFWFWATNEFTPLAMAILPSFYILEHFQQERLERDSFYRSFEHPEPSNYGWPLIFIIFVAAQFPETQNVYPAPILNLQKPVFSENCRLMLFERQGTALKQIGMPTGKKIPAELQCNPQLNLNLVKSMCDSSGKKPEFGGITAIFLTRALSDTEFQIRFALKNACTEKGAL